MPGLSLLVKPPISLTRTCILKVLEPFMDTKSICPHAEANFKDLAITIIAKLISDYISSPCKVKAICDNSGAVKCCSKLQFKSLRSHHQPNSDLFITQNILTSPNNISLEWVRGHADKKPWSSVEDLQSQQLSRDEIYNVWCDRMAGEAWKSSFPIIEDPDVYVWWR